MRRLWFAFAAVMVLSFGVLGWIGTRIYQEMPPLPDRVVTADGQTVIDSGEIQAGQGVWQTLGGMEVGSVWGHGSYVAPDWTADYLHRECVFILDRWAGTDGRTMMGCGCSPMVSEANRWGPRLPVSIYRADSGAAEA